MQAVSKTRDAYNKNVSRYGNDVAKLYDETDTIPFNNDAVKAALEKNAEGAQWGTETRVYVPTAAEMDAANELHNALREAVDGGHNDQHGIGEARRIADTLAAYEEARKGATTL